ncbi:MAG: transposase [Candidatus Pacebacteria bacterium]|nr:transposase [Candidatus Paceibacterota bacterium]
MFKKTTTQSSLFEVVNYLPNALPESDWCFMYSEQILPLIDEELFRPFYSETHGRYNAPIKTMISLLIFMGTEKLTWRDMEFLFPRRLDWLTATHTPIGEGYIDHTTLFKFYSRMEESDATQTLFNDLTNRFIELCGTSVKKQRTDSFFIHGWLKTLSRYGLFKETIRSFLLALNKHKSGLYAQIASGLSKDYLKGEFDITEKDHTKAQKMVTKMAHDLYKIKCAFENHKQVQHYESFKTLCLVFSQQCELQETSKEEYEIIIKEKPDKDCLSTPHNTDARYTRKRDQKVTGDKGFVTETCDPLNNTQFITDTSVTKSTEPDCKEQPNLLDRLGESKRKPEELFGDAGFVNGETILDAEKKDVVLEGPTAGHSQLLDTYHSTDRNLDVSDFDVYIDTESDTMIIESCPCGNAPIDQHRSEKTGKINAHFDVNTCNNCNEKERCPVKIGSRTATVTMNEADVIGARRHHKYMNDKEYRKKCSIRAGAEALVSEITGKHGMRRSRHKKRTRTKLQLIFAALACNVKRFLRHGMNYGFMVPNFAN